MKKATIIVNEESYPIKFGYGSLRLLGEEWGLKGFQEVAMKVQSLIPTDENADLGFETTNGIGTIVYAGMQNASREPIDVSIDDILDALFEDMALITEIFKLFIESMPKDKGTAGKSKPKKATASK